MHSRLIIVKNLSTALGLEKGKKVVYLLSFSLHNKPMWMSIIIFIILKMRKLEYDEK